MSGQFGATRAREGSEPISDSIDTRAEEPHSTMARLQMERNQINLAAPDDSAHRERITHLIRTLIKPGAGGDLIPEMSMLVLGAGNCRDIDLTSLFSDFQEIFLADIDASALQRVSQQHAAAGSRLQIFAPVDVAWPLLQKLPPNSPDTSTSHSIGVVDAALVHPSAEQPSRLLRSLAGDYWPYQIPQARIVVSSCLLTQLIECLSLIASPDSQEYVRAIQALRIGHLRRLINQCLPGGSILLITDVVSSDVVPELLHVSAIELKALLRRCLAERHHFSGCHPDRVINDLQILAAATGSLRRVRIHDPWIWRLGPRAYAVYAVEAEVLKRSPEPALPAWDIPPEHASDD